MSPKDVDFYGLTEDTTDVTCVAEHHIKQPSEASGFQTLQKSGWKLVTAPARSTSEEHRGTKGGTFVIMRKHLQSVGVVRPCDGGKGFQTGQQGRQDWTGRRPW